MNRECLFPNLDIAKLIMAFLVVEIHTKPFNDISSDMVSRIVSGIDSVAVPFFFIASGFLCFRGLAICNFVNGSSSDVVRVQKTIRKQLSLYMIWTVLLLPLALFGAYLRGWDLPETITRLMRGVIFVGENDFTWPLWYLLASVIGFVLIYVLLRGGVSPKSIVVLSGALLISGYAMQMLHGWNGAPEPIAFLLDVYYSIFGTVRNGVFEGFFYIAIGMLIGFGWASRPEGNPAAVYACLLVGAVCCIAIEPDAHLPFCALFAVSLFLLCVRRTGNESHPWARKASTVVYLVHMVFVVIFVYGICGYADIGYFDAPISHVALYAFTLGCSLLVAAIAISLSRRTFLLKKIFCV